MSSYQLTRYLIVAFFVWAISFSVQAQSVVNLGIRFFQVTAELAVTPDQRARGLMGRTSLPANHGMLFVFESPAVQCFWMKNTPLPLTIAFIDGKGRISSTADMKPFSEEAHCSKEPVIYALEMEQGWFARRGILAGDLVTGLR